MIKQVIVLSKCALADLVVQFPGILDRHPVISIADPGESRVFDCVHESLLNLTFCDIEPGGLSEQEQRRYPPFSGDDARAVRDFLQRHRSGSGSQVLIVQCHAGIARSGAIGRYAVETLGMDLDAFLRQNPLIDPNEFVLETLRAKL